MTTFGEALRAIRQMSHDPERNQRLLSQGRLGELIGHMLEDGGFSGAAVSNWERGDSRISAEDRKVLIALIKVLHKCGGLKTPEDANQLLEAGNYRALNQGEEEEIFGEISPVGAVKSQQIIAKSLPVFLLENLFALSGAQAKTLLADAEEGPSPSWPRVLVVFLRKAGERFSLSPRSILWLWLCLLAWLLIAPSLRWPFANRNTALLAVEMYVIGTLIIPLLAGLLVNTKDNPYWRQQGLANSTILRLYTYQGAGIGFNLGYFFVFPFVLVRYYFRFEPAMWLEFVAIILGLILANLSARVVPYNLWRAYGRLKLADGAIFFIVALLGPLWGTFFLQTYPVLLTPLLGSTAILLALTLYVMIGARQPRKSTGSASSKLK